VPALGLLPLADDDVQTVVLHIERLSAALHAVAENGNGFLAENGLDAVRRIVRAFHDGFFDGPDLDFPHGAVSSEAKWSDIRQEEIVGRIGTEVLWELQDR